MVEIGENLEWPDESEWLYNGGNGRSWEEIKRYRG
jgi:hypothetical protein